MENENDYEANEAKHLRDIKNILLGVPNKVNADVYSHNKMKRNERNQYSFGK